MTNLKVGGIVAWPMGIRKLVNWINDNYNPGEIFISENGWTNGNLGYNDTDRIEYLNVPKRI